MSDSKVPPTQEDDAAARFLAEIKERAETMSRPDDERDLFSFAADVARKIGMLPGTYTRRGGVGIDVWTAGSRRGQPRYRVWVERGENGHLSAYGANNFEAARTDVPRLLEAVEAVLAIHVPQQVYALSVMASDTRNPPRVWCGHTYEETENDRHQMTDDDSIICLDKHEGTVCAGCWEESGGEPVEWPCPTYRAISAPLLWTDREAAADEH